VQPAAKCPRTDRAVAVFGTIARQDVDGSRGRAVAESRWILPENCRQLACAEVSSRRPARPWLIGETVGVARCDIGCHLPMNGRAIDTLRARRRHGHALQLRRAPPPRVGTQRATVAAHIVSSKRRRSTRVNASEISESLGMLQRCCGAHIAAGLLAIYLRIERRSSLASKSATQSPP
jgi:hypothetical protein